MSSDLAAEIVGRVFPPGTALTWTPKDVPPESRFLVFPSMRDLRWILPWQPHRGRAALSLWRPYRHASRLGWGALKVTYRAGLLHAVPGVTSFGVAGSQTWSHLGLPDAMITAALYVGTPGPTRKAVAFLSTPGSNLLASVAKVPLGIRAGAAILHEAEMLERLAVKAPDLGPRVLFVDRSGGRVVQTPVLGRRVGRRFTHAHLALQESLRRNDTTTSLRDQSERIADEAKRWAAARDGPEVLARLARFNNSRPLPAVWTHGDFAPWNLCRVAEGLVALDWEKCSPDGLPLYDVLHYHLIQDFLLGKRRLGSRGYRKAARLYLEALGINPALHDQLFELALLKSWTEAVKESAAARAAFVAQWLARLDPP